MSTPLTLLPLQLAASSAFLFIVATIRREPLAWSPAMRRLAGFGVLNPGLAYALGSGRPDHHHRQPVGPAVGG